MGLEVATYINGLVPTNPLSNDKKKEGDDHLRLLKGALQNTFPNADRPFYFPTVVTVSANTVLATSADQSTIYVDTTTGAKTITLPTTTVFGWTIDVGKSSNDNNPVYIVPPSGNINGFSKIRLNIPFMVYTFVWTGGSWLRKRVAGEIQPGTFEPFGGSIIPNGFLSPAAQLLLRADYPELFSAFGTTYGAGDGSTTFGMPDVQGRVLAGIDPGSTRLDTTTLGQSPATVGNVGGLKSKAILQTNLPSLTLPVTIPAFAHGLMWTVPFSGSGLLGGAGPSTGPANTGTTPVTVSSPNIPAHVGTVPTGGGDVALPLIQPTQIVNYIIRAC